MLRGLGLTGSALGFLMCVGRAWSINPTYDWSAQCSVCYLVYIEVLYQRSLPFRVKIITLKISTTSRRSHFTGKRGSVLKDSAPQPSDFQDAMCIVAIRPRIIYHVRLFVCTQCFNLSYPRGKQLSYNGPIFGPRGGK